MVASSSARRLVPWLGAVAALGIVAWCFPLFHIVRLDTRPVAGSAAVFDPAAVAEKIWREKLTPATRKATQAGIVLLDMSADPAEAKKKHAHQVGIGGTAYYFVRGTGLVSRIANDDVVVAIDGTEGMQVVLRLGPLFGNTVRDGTGLLNVNEFPGLAEFNALSAELNRIVEAQVFASARGTLRAGARIAFAGCAEAPESVGAGPLLAVVPMEIRAQP